MTTGLKRGLVLSVLLAAAWVLYRSGQSASRSYPDRRSYYADLYRGRKDLAPVVVYREGWSSVVLAYTLIGWKCELVSYTL
jgi:hypothetical protein